MVQERQVILHGPAKLGPLSFESAEISEALSRPFRIELSFSCSNPFLAPQDIVGQVVSLEAQLPTNASRFWSGVVTALARRGRSKADLWNYSATIEPALSVLDKRIDCRLWKDVSSLDVVQKLLRQYGIQFETSVIGTYAKRDLIVQYRESVFNFISRLLEHEGVYYYFLHEKGQHKLMLADPPAELAPVEGYDEIPLFPDGNRQKRRRDHIDRIELGWHVISGSTATAAFDFRNPTGVFSAGRSAPPIENDAFGHEVFELAGHVLASDEVDHQAVRRWEGILVDHATVHGSGNAMGLAVGAFVKIVDYENPADAASKFLVTSLRHTFVVGAYESGGSDDGPDYRCSFAGVPDGITYRPPATASKPLIPGPQTAIVVGDNHHEIDTDEHARVKVQFHWDRYSQSNEESSCWVRVSQVWAGSGFGAVFIPRKGQEVIVEFLDGDPDQPIITGRVYNGDNRAPYGLPANKSQSGIKTRSTPGGAPAHANEIRFEDKKGSEELFVQAEKNQTTVVKNNQSVSVAANRSVSVGANSSLSVSGERSVTVTKKDDETFHDTRTVKVEKTDDLTITLKHTGNYDGGREVTVKQFDNTTVNGANKNDTIHGQYNITADEHYKVQQGANQIFVKDQVYVESMGQVQLKNQQCHVDLKDGKITLTAATEISLVCGGSSITLKADGTIEIHGSQKVAAAGASSSVELAAAGASMSGTKATISGSAVTEITGAIIKLN